MMSRLTLSFKTPVRNHQHPPSPPWRTVRLLTHLFSCKNIENWHISELLYIKMIFDVKDDPILQDSSQEPSTSSKSTMEERVVLDTLIFMLEC